MFILKHTFVKYKMWFSSSFMLYIFLILFFVGERETFYLIYNWFQESESALVRLWEKTKINPNISFYLRLDCCSLALFSGIVHNLHSSFLSLYHPKYCQIPLNCSFQVTNFDEVKVWFNVGCGFWNWRCIAPTGSVNLLHAFDLSVTLPFSLLVYSSGSS